MGPAAASHVIATIGTTYIRKVSMPAATPVHFDFSLRMISDIAISIRRYDKSKQCRQISGIDTSEAEVGSLPRCPYFLGQRLLPDFVALAIHCSWSAIDRQ